MEKANPFDFVCDTQAVYRRLLEAFANPGRVVGIAGPMSRMARPHPALCCVAATLLDNAVTFSVPGDGALERELHEMTLARPVPAEEADFVFLPSPEAPFALERVMPGTSDAPHRSATVVAAVGNVPGRTAVLRGPGVKGESAVRLPERAAALLAQRDAAAWDYPTGADLVFVREDGYLFAVPRRVAVTMREVG